MPTRWNDLTPRHQSLIWMLTRGLSNQQIADTLGLKLSTVRNGLREAYEIIGVSSRLQAMRWCLEQPESGAYQALVESAA